MLSPMEHFSHLSWMGLPIVLWQLTLAFILILTLATLTSRHPLSNGILLAESLMGTIKNMLHNVIGLSPSSLQHLPLIFSLFWSILLINLIGLLPYSATLTVEFSLTLLLATTMLIGLLIGALQLHGPRLAAAFLPSGIPFAMLPFMIILELLAYFTRMLSLGLRLAINMLVGHLLAKIMIGFVWIGMEQTGQALSQWLMLLTLGALAGVMLTGMATLGLSTIAVLFMALEILIAYLQAYIFAFIITITIKDLSPISRSYAHMGTASVSFSRPPPRPSCLSSFIHWLILSHDPMAPPLASLSGSFSFSSPPMPFSHLPFLLVPYAPLLLGLIPLTPHPLSSGGGCLLWSTL